MRLSLIHISFEGLNNASSTPNNLLIILNDNNMAIDRSVGGMKQYLLNLDVYKRQSFREGDVLELEAFDKEGKSICNWTYPIRLAKQYFDHKMAQRCV